MPHGQRSDDSSLPPIRQVEQRTEETAQPNLSPTDRGVFLPRQLADQLTNLLQHPVSATPQNLTTQLQTSIITTEPIPHHSIVSTATMTRPQDPADETLSAASSMQHLTLSNPNVVNQRIVPNPVPTLMDQSLMINSHPAGITEPAQQSLPPVPSRVKERIIKGEYIDFASLLPKAMFSSSTDPDLPGLVTVHLPSSSEDISVRPATKPKKITSFSSWMEAWNVYLAVIIEHMPSRAPSLVAYQRIITSASVQYPLESWLNYDVQF